MIDCNYQFNYCYSKEDRESKIRCCNRQQGKISDLMKLQWHEFHVHSHWKQPNSNNEKYPIQLEIVYTFRRLVCNTDINYYYAQKFLSNLFQIHVKEIDVERKGERKRARVRKITRHHDITFCHSVILHHNQASIQPREWMFDLANAQNTFE